MANVADMTDHEIKEALVAQTNLSIFILESHLSLLNFVSRKIPDLTKEERESWIKQCERIKEDFKPSRKLRTKLTRRDSALVA